MSTFRPGSIRQIKLKDFVTYNCFSFNPGANLNMILGPNGSGKSSIVSAIVIGLGGNLNVIGRSTNLSNFIREGATESLIEIKITNKDDAPDIKIQRKFSMDGSNNYYINGTKKTVKEVHSLCKTFNIQVDNLCQFLPQDKVQDFAKMNPQELLTNTLKSVASVKLSESLTKLIDLRKEHRSSQKLLEQLSVQVQDAKEKNDRVQATVENIQLQQELLLEITVCKIKILWIDYNNFRVQYHDLIEDRKQVELIIKGYQEKLDPFRTETNRIDQLISAMSNRRSLMKKTVTNLTSKLQHLQEQIESKQQELNSQKTDYDRKLLQARNRNTEIEEIDKAIQALTQEITNTLGQHEDKSSFDKRIKELSTKSNEHLQKIEEFKSKHSSCSLQLNGSIEHEILMCVNKIEQINNVQKRKLDVVRQYKPDVYKLCLWVLENQGLFEKEVFLPMVVSLNVKNPDYANYAENVIGKNDLFAFVCQSPEDMNRLIKKGRQEMRLQMSVICSAPGQLQHYKSQISIQQLRNLGFYSYILDMLDGPEPILSFLCKSYNIHNVPVGDHRTNTISDQLPRSIRLYFSDEFRFYISISSYTGVRSIVQNSINQAKLLHISLNENALEQTKARLTVLRRGKDDLRNNISVIETSIRREEELHNRIVAEKRQFELLKRNLDKLNYQIKREEDKKNMLCNEIVDVDKETQRFKKIVQGKGQLISKICSELVGNFLEYVKINGKVELINNIINKYTIIYRNKKSELDEITQNIKEKEHTLERIQISIRNFKQECKIKFDDALKSSNNVSPTDTNFPHKTKFENLPSNIDEINTLIDETQARCDCLNIGDDNLYEEYTSRNNQINEGSKKITEETKRKEKVLKEIEEVRNYWLTEVNSLISQIHKNFGKYMEYMSCAGEVILLPGPTEHDYDQYGIGIKVRYRDGEVLQELNQHTQSGGERAVATAIYMLSLQGLSKVPFRCVDEINQGMDSTNERRVIELLMKLTTQEGTPQYFLLTPKLLPQLKYSQKALCNIVHNSKSMRVTPFNINTLVELRSSLHARGAPVYS